MIGQPLLADAELIALTTGAIIGEDAGSTQLAMQFSPGRYMTTRTLTPGQSGDMQRLPEFGAECWFNLNALPSATRYILRGPTSNSGQIQWHLSHTSTGALTATIITTTGTYTTTTSALLTPGRWHHLVATANNLRLSIYVNGVEQSGLAHTGVFKDLDTVATGSPEMWVNDPSSTHTTAFDEIAVYRLGLTAAAVLAHYRAGAERGFVQQLTGTRITSVLDAVGSSAPRRIGVGARTIMALRMTGQDPLSELRRAVQTESVDAMLFVARDGTLVFLDSAHRSASPYDTIQATFDDDGSDLSYLELDLDYSDAFLANEWNVTRIGNEAVTQTAADAASIARYFKRPLSWSDIPVTTDAQALTIAQAMLAKYKEHLTRITSITLSTAVPDLAEAIFRREIGDKIRVLRTPPGGGTRIDQALWIQKIDISGSSDQQPWQVRWGVSPV